VAFAAVTVKVDELPKVIEAGLAVMPAVGAAGVALNCVPLHPASSMGSTGQRITEKRTLLRDWRTVDFVKAPSLLSR
jgi:hypothetical protein